MKKHEHPTNRLEKMSNFFGGGNFSKLNLYLFSTNHVVSFAYLYTNAAK